MKRPSAGFARAYVEVKPSFSTILPHGRSHSHLNISTREKVQLYALLNRLPLPHTLPIYCKRPLKQAAMKSISDYTIELMKMGPRDTYLCFTPPPIKQDPPPPEETITEVTASHSWSLLQPLDGTCLYVCDASLHTLFQVMRLPTAF